jgi:hypothetical protein
MIGIVALLSRVHWPWAIHRRLGMLYSCFWVCMRGRSVADRREERNTRGRARRLRLPGELVRLYQPVEGPSYQLMSCAGRLSFELRLYDILVREQEVVVHVEHADIGDVQVVQNARISP